MNYRSGVDQKVSTALAFLIITSVGAFAAFIVLHTLNTLDVTNEAEVEALNI